MTASNPHEIPFNGVRIRFDSKKNFDELVSALLADVGDKPLMIDELRQSSKVGNRTRPKWNRTWAPVASYCSG